MPSNETKIKFQLKNIGPHEDLTFQSEKNIDYAIFATNGQGKTFISRCFAALQDDNYPYVGNLTSFGRYTSSFDIVVPSNIFISSVVMSTLFSSLLELS